MLVEVLKAIGYLGVGVGAMIALMCLMFLGLGKVPMEDPAVPAEEMLAQYVHFTRRAAVVSSFYTMVTVGLWVAPWEYQDQVRSVVPIIGSVTLFAWLSIPGALIARSGIKQRSERGEYGLTPEEIAAKRRKEILED